MEIIKSKLFFLINKYGFEYSHHNERGNRYIFKNKYGELEFYQWEQFDEEAIFVKYDYVSKKIDLYKYYPKIYGQFIETHKGLKSIFKNKKSDYWEMISIIIKKEIEDKNKIFGLPI